MVSRTPTSSSFGVAFYSVIGGPSFVSLYQGTMQMRNAVSHLLPYFQLVAQTNYYIIFLPKGTIHTQNMSVTLFALLSTLWHKQYLFFCFPFLFFFFSHNTLKVTPNRVWVYQMNASSHKKAYIGFTEKLTLGSKDLKVS